MKILELLLLLVHDLLILELEQLPLFLKVGHNLAQTLLKKVNLSSQKFDLLVFLELALCMLLHCLALLLQLVVSLLIV